MLTSDIRGIREQVATPGCWSILDPWKRLRTASTGCGPILALAARLADDGRQRLGRYTPADYRERLLKILEAARRRLHTSNCNRMAVASRSDSTAVPVC